MKIIIVAALSYLISFKSFGEFLQLHVSVIYPTDPEGSTGFMFVWRKWGLC